MKSSLSNFCTLINMIRRIFSRQRFNSVSLTISLFIFFLTFVHQTIQSQQFSDDAIQLTLQYQSSIKLDTILAAQIEIALMRARTVHDTLQYIHIYPDYPANQLVVHSDETWAFAWRSGNIKTGCRPLDSLTNFYGVDSVYEDFSGSGNFILSFSSPMNISKLLREFNKLSLPITCDANYGGWIDGDRIDAIRYHDTWLFAFSYGWGDCPMGCVYRHYWYVSVSDSGDVQLVDELPPPHRIVKIHTWNIPDRFPATVFHSVDDLLKSYNAKEWWVRRHAVIVTRYLADNSYPWVGEDIKNLTVFNSLRNEMMTRKKEIILALLQSMRDTEFDIAWHAKRALILLSGVASPGIYFPLAVGNEWVFKSGNQYLTERIVSANVDSTFTRRFRFNTFRGFDSLEFQEAEDDLLARRQMNEYYWVRFMAGPKDHWDVPISSTNPKDVWTVSLESINDSVTVPAGTFTNVYRFHFKYSGTDNDWLEYYAPFVGPIKRTLLGFGVIDYELFQYHVADSIKTNVVERKIPDDTKPQLIGNYPNPIQDNTSISFILHRPQNNVRVTIQDLLGREVATIVNGIFQSGRYDVSFNAHKCPTGIYQINLYADEYVTTKTCVVLH